MEYWFRLIPAILAENCREMMYNRGHQVEADLTNNFKENENGRR